MDLDLPANIVMFKFKKIIRISSAFFQSHISVLGYIPKRDLIKTEIKFNFQLTYNCNLKFQQFVIVICLISGNRVKSS